MTVQPRKQIILGAHFPGVNNTSVWSDPGRPQPGRVRLVRPPRPDRRAGQVRLLLPRRGPAAARAAGQDPRPRRRRAARHAGDPRPPSPPSRRTSGSPARSTPRTTRPTSWPASCPRSTTCPTGGRPGTSSRRRTPSPARTSAAAASSTTPTATCAPASSSARPASCGTRGPTTSSWPTRRPGSSCAPARPGAFELPRRSSSTSPATSRCRAARSATRSSSRPATRPAGASSPRRRPTPSSAGTRSWPPGRRSTTDVKSRLARYGRSRDELKITPGRHVRARRHAGRGGREGPPHPPPAGQPADGDPAPRAGLEPGPVGLRRRGPAARHRPRRVGDVDHPGAGPDARRSDEDGGRVPGRAPRPRASASAS